MVFLYDSFDISLVVISLKYILRCIRHIYSTRSNVSDAVYI